MRQTLTKVAVGRFLALVLVTSLAWVGCSNEDSITGVQNELVTDPLGTVLNATLGFTPSNPESRIDRLAETLGLSDEQKEALSAAYATFRSGIEALKDQVDAGDLTRDEAKVEAEAFREAFEAELQVILTEDQYNQLQEMRAGRGGRHGFRNHVARWDGWLEEIGATAEQIAAVEEALTTLKEGMSALRDEVRSGDLTREEAKAEAELLRDAFDSALQDILSAEQYAELEELRPDCSHLRG